MRLPFLFLLGISLVHGSDALSIRDIPSPAGPGSQCSNLTAAPDGTLHLTWSQPASTADDGRSLLLSTLPPGASAWSAPRPIVTTALLMENWADFASLVVGTDGALTAQWFQKTSPDAGGYDGWFARSTDGGASWTTPAHLGHEFVSLAPLSGGRTLAVWLESARPRDPNAPPRPKRDPKAPPAPRPPRQPGEPYAPSMKLLARLLAPDGSTLRDWTVDPDVCTCCQTTTATLPGDRVFVAYRGHTSDEIRDNHHALFDRDRWSAPRPLANDNWLIPACPVNGPAADARGETLAVAWFTAAGSVPRVQARHSTDGGRTFGPIIPIDLGKPMGRIETVMLPDHSAVILWMEIGTAENAAGIYARRLFPDGALSAPRLVADSSQARASGFPRAALRAGGRLVMSWTQAGEPGCVRTLEFDPASLTRTVTTQTATQPPLRPGLAAARPATLEFCVAPISSSH